MWGGLKYFDAFRAIGFRLPAIGRLLEIAVDEVCGCVRPSGEDCGHDLVMEVHLV